MDPLDQRAVNRKINHGGRRGRFKIIHRRDEPVVHMAPHPLAAGDPLADGVAVHSRVGAQAGDAQSPHAGDEARISRLKQQRSAAVGDHGVSS